ncbi:NET1-associated nuclear protein 1 (U3 small nucleolar RNA-associated protein 17) [Cryptococcus wingfieldii CBS 7118]|uniref:NET1-associated nuclear protein 1 (U3 small nucleolar RNA-associated protein 17) n=1 Tax=Cryptococcus wingfieldii CBS 7118 TaxID=1295528 RepID=A0A1E3JS28_9TREE|nr:NET1-associated nuclear protein 1 (U3 small nucleolar RNA-associated protein 17) [Cryptococcus wingfieldii CBS 7118]ODO03476.1 NET1-associated nuclear protein 1 (U3 small nucleolar RNA-associated protein 17) [Cryptococcus wingfieldii CBS 7118]
MAQNTQTTPKPRAERHRHKHRKELAEAGLATPSAKGKERAVEVPTATTPGADGKAGKKRRKRQVPNGGPIHEGASAQQHAESSASALRRTGDEETWDPIPVAQNEVSRVPLVWSTDGRFYLSVVHTSIHVHSSVAPDFTRLSTLSSTHAKGHTKAITSLHLSPINPFQAISSSLDGTVKVWDWITGRLVRTIEIQEPSSKVEHVTFGQVAGKWWLFAAVTHSKPSSSGSKLAYKVLRMPLSGKTSPVLLGKLSNPPVALMMSPRNTYLVALASTKAYTYRMPVSSKAFDPWQDRPTCVKFVSDQPFTCGAFCPEKALASAKEEEWFATGDQQGVIRLWHGLTQAFLQVDAATRVALGGIGDTSKAVLPETEKRLPTTSLHWHAHAVAAIAFTPSGSQLLSVGEESVLVQWHLASGRREYIPRLGGRPIISLAVRRATGTSEEEWWMSLADGSVIRVGGSTSSIANVGQGIRLDPLRPSSPDVSYPISVHPATRALVVPSSHPSTLQFIDPIASTVIFDLEVVPSNRVSRRDEKELEPVRVEKVTFTEEQDGKSTWMATMEGRKGDEGEGGGLVKTMKIWKWVDERYMVNTQFPRPHSTADITSMSFTSIPAMATASKSVSGPHPYLITTSGDGVAKIWQVKQSKKSEQVHWSCRSTFNYRNLSIISSASSADASILALCHSSVVTLWDIASNILLKVLDVPAGVDARTVEFVGKEGRWLVGAGSTEGLVSWDLLSCEVSWSLPSLPVSSLVPSTASTFFTVAASSAAGTSFRVFDPTSAVPLRTVNISHQSSRLLALPSATGSEAVSSLHLVSVSPSGEIYRLGDLVSSSSRTAIKNVSQAKTFTGLSIWQEMFGKGAFLQDSELEEPATATATALQQRVANNLGRPADVFEGPSHTMPPTSMLFDAFMDELLSGNQAPREEKQEKNVEQGDAIVYEVEVDESREERDETKILKAKDVADEDVKELEVFFRDLLSSTPRAPNTPALRKPHPVRNGLPSHISSAQNTPSRSVSTPVPKKANGHGPRGSLLASASKDMDSDMGTPSSTTGSGKKKAKKRKAPQE